MQCFNAHKWSLDDQYDRYLKYISFDNEWRIRRVCMYVCILDLCHYALIEFDNTKTNECSDIYWVFQCRCYILSLNTCCTISSKGRLLFSMIHLLKKILLRASNCNVLNQTHAKNNLYAVHLEQEFVATFCWLRIAMMQQSSLNFDIQSRFTSYRSIDFFLHRSSNRGSASDTT